MTTLLLIAQYIINCQHNSKQDLKDDQILIEFEDVNPDNIGYYSFGNSASNSSFMFAVKEEIKGYPANFEPVHTFHLILQQGQYVLNLTTEDETVHDYIYGQDSDVYNRGISYSDYLESRYTTKPVDCLVSVCIVKNQDDEEFVIIDSNNDEDFTNDPVLSYFAVPSDAIPEWINIQSQESVESDAEVEYYDGKEIQTAEIPIRLSKIIRNDTQYYNYTIHSVKIGKATIDGTAYRVVLSSLVPMIDYDVGASIEIDSDQNSKFDRNDFSARLYQPFSFNGMTYDLAEIDPMGNYIILNKTDVPVVELGHPAPDFTSVTIDSVEFQLSGNQGKYILLDFWGSWCGPCLGELPTLKEAYAQFRGETFEIVSIDVGEPLSRMLPFIEENELNWTHIWEKNAEIQRLYQVSGVPSPFLINPNGIIVAEGIELRGDNLIATLEKYLN